MTKLNRKFWGAILIALFLVVLSGCGGTGQSTHSESASNTAAATNSGGTDQAAKDKSSRTEEKLASDAEQDTRIVSTVHGDVEIPAHPQRIVTQGYLANFLALGIKPVGAPYWELESPYVKSLSAGIEDIGQIDGGSVEKMLSLNPDLIVTVGGDEKLNEQYRKIAPTIVIPYGTYHEVHVEMKAFGAMIGKEMEAEEWLAVFDQKVKKAKASIQGLVKEGTTFSIMGPFGKDFYIYGDTVNRGGQAIHQQLGLTPTDKVRKDLINKKINALSISQEKMADYAGDYIFLDISGGAEFDENSPIWASLDAVKNNRVFKLDGDRFWPYDPIAVQSQVEEVAAMIQERQGTTK
ncbi:ABC transporter substrate-binding protein [Paenibacillus profundus]|uniref:ABC transporter substrate-binding protein n=1 Tax=Paenibacillus profundus TaxID=1173085 RepID=A0ABS8YJX5_9BACL|nr:ABC transporter substrate-binding protein [Paenibacillus profundus]MCE5170753.1 ABC transporter substrate-binding protein [Paenibacillus profundus]